MQLTTKATLVGVTLRGALLASKFLFVFFAARFLPLEGLGTYSLIVATIAYALYLVGMDFYTFTTREVIGVDAVRQGGIVLDQFRVYLITFCVFFLPLMGVFWFGVLDWQWAVIFYLLLLSEHLSLELFRLLVALGHPVRANLLLFVRSASWTYLALVAFWLFPTMRDVHWVLYLWLVASASAVVLGVWWLRFVPWSQVFVKPLPASWVVRGLKVALPLLVATLAMRAVFTLDRYAVEWLDGIAMVGVYAVYLGLCGAMLSFMEVAVFQFAYPKLVELAKSRQHRAFQSAMGALTGKVAACVVVGVVGLWGLAEPVLVLLGKPEFLQQLSVFWWLLAAQVLLVVSYIPHYGLYALGQDRWIVYGHIIPLLAFILGLLCINSPTGIERVVLSLVIAFGCTLLIKVAGFIKSYNAFLISGDRIVHVR